MGGVKPMVYGKYRDFRVISEIFSVILLARYVDVDNYTPS
jgi:hypothetical protein